MTHWLRRCLCHLWRLLYLAFRALFAVVGFVWRAAGAAWGDALGGD